MNQSANLPDHRPTCVGFLRRLLDDRAGNTLALVAAATLPILGMVGGSIDMGRSYLSQSRLQQACDAGVLAARKKLGSDVVVTGDVPDDVAETGNKFFNLSERRLTDEITYFIRADQVRSMCDLHSQEYRRRSRTGI